MLVPSPRAARVCERVEDGEPIGAVGGDGWAIGLEGRTFGLLAHADATVVELDCRGAALEVVELDVVPAAAAEHDAGLDISEIVFVYRVAGHRVCVARQRTGRFKRVDLGRFALLHAERS